jgi:hypothetical protein
MSNKEIQNVLAKMSHVEFYNKSLQGLEQLKDDMPYELYRKYIDNLSELENEIIEQIRDLQHEIKSTYKKY